MAVNLKEAVALLQNGEWHSLRLFQANIAKGTGGKVLELAKCKIAGRQSLAVATGSKSASGHTKNPNHSFNFTRNVELQNKSIITIHPILITHINQQPVL